MITRMTNQRIKILDYLKSIDNHPSAEMVYDNVVKELPKITLATVYRNLNLLAEQGEILKLEVGSEYRYDRNIGFHQHLICKKCKKIIDIFQKNIPEDTIKKIKNKEFTTESVIVIFYGYCKKCGE